MTIHAQYLRQHLVFYDTNLLRWRRALGSSVVTWELRSQDCEQTGVTGTDPRGYFFQPVEVGLGTAEMEASDEAGFVAEGITPANENDGFNMQAVGEAFRPTTARHIYFGIALQAAEATQNDLWVGLSITTQNALGGVTDSIRFEKLDGSTAWGCATEKDSTETVTASVHTFAANTTVTLEFLHTGSSVTFAVNGAEVAKHTTNIPDDEALSPCMQFLNGVAGAQRIKIAWARAISIG